MRPDRWRLVMLGVVAMASMGCRSVLGIEQTEVDPAICTWLTQRVFFDEKPVSDTTVTVGMVTQARLAELAGELGVSLDPSRGHGLAKVLDCGDEAAAFADAEFDPTGPEVTTFAVAGERLVLGTATGVEGVLGALNLVTPEEVPVTAYPDEIDIPSSVGDIVTRAGELSRITLRPNSEITDVPSMSVSDWDCVGMRPAELPTEPTITLTVEVQASRAFVPGGVPIEGVRVAVCLSDAASCDAGAPLSEGQGGITDASGRLELVVETGDEGFDGHLVVSGPVVDCEP